MKREVFHPPSLETQEKTKGSNACRSRMTLFSLSHPWNAEERCQSLVQNRRCRPNEILEHGFGRTRSALRFSGAISESQHSTLSKTHYLKERNNEYEPHQGSAQEENNRAPGASRILAYGLPRQAKEPAARHGLIARETLPKTYLPIRPRKIAAHRATNIRPCGLLCKSYVNLVPLPIKITHIQNHCRTTGF